MRSRNQYSVNKTLAKTRQISKKKMTFCKNCHVAIYRYPKDWFTVSCRTKSILSGKVSATCNSLIWRYFQRRHWLATNINVQKTYKSNNQNDPWLISCSKAVFLLKLSSLWVDIQLLLISVVFVILYPLHFLVRSPLVALLTREHIQLLDVVRPHILAISRTQSD